ncbi:hypothetical protein L208DRAFT_1328002, partial [Tricholoma matsutake]
TPSTHSLNLAIELQMTDTGGVSALLDSGATSLFINAHLAQQHCLKTRSLSCLIPVYNVDGSPNEADAEVVDLVLHYKDHSKRALFAVTQLGKQKVILGYP